MTQDDNMGDRSLVDSSIKVPKYPGCNIRDPYKRVSMVQYGGLIVGRLVGHVKIEAVII